MSAWPSTSRPPRISVWLIFPCLPTDRHVGEARADHVPEEEHARQGDERRQQVEVDVAHGLDHAPGVVPVRKRPAMLASAESSAYWVAVKRRLHSAER